MDIHNKKFQTFITHQLSVEQAEVLWQLFEQVDKITKPTPITEAEIKTFKVALDNGSSKSL